MSYVVAGNLTVLVGKNSSGKSNVLRALNLFFNDEIEPGKPLDLSRDFHSRPTARRKKEIVISVDFELDTAFRFRKSLATVRLALGTTFTIQRKWELNAQQATVSQTHVLINGTRIPDDENIARQFLGLVSYRYIPNRTVPSALLREESRMISGSIFARMRGESGAQTLINAVKSAADRLLEGAAASMKDSGAPLSDVTIASAASLADMLSVSGFQAKGMNGNTVGDEEWGAGNQAFFLYEVLHAVDTNYSRTFGWKQVAIWGVEEPESGLHRDLETRLADEMSAWSNDLRLRLQILQTTHSPIFTMAADKGYWIELVSGASVVKLVPIGDLVRDAETKGVSGWVQPILAFPSSPVVLVEGFIDAEALSHTARLLGMHRIRFLSLPELDAAERRGGKDAVTTYLKRHGGLIPNRPKENPLVVLLDWDVSNTELAAAQRAYGGHGAVAVVKMKEAHCDPAVSDEFSGIERFYPPQLIRAAAAAGEFVIGDPGGGVPISISSQQLSIAKERLRSRIQASTSAGDLPALSAVVRDAEAVIAAVAAIP